MKAKIENRSAAYDFVGMGTGIRDCRGAVGGWVEPGAWISAAPHPRILEGVFFAITAD